jgi:hypothetical protein
MYNGLILLYKFVSYVLSYVFIVLPSGPVDPGSNPV